VLSILLNAFIALFALDSFGEPQWLLVLFIHLIPNYLLAGATYVAWKHPKLGGLLFIGLGLLFIGLTSAEALILIIPVFMIGFLYLIQKNT